MITRLKKLMLLIILAAFVNVAYTQVISEGLEKEFYKWADRPPMGWNSYDCFGATVNEEEVRGNADMMAAHLKRAGWEYIVVDYCWYYPYVGALNNPPQTRDFKPSLPMDAYGRLQPAVDRFPSAEDGHGFKQLADYVHSLGLKFGIHIMRGISREAVARKTPVMGTNYTADQIADKNSLCGWLNLMYGVDMRKPGAQEYYNSLFVMYASWGVDYVKVDDISSPYYAAEIEAVRKAVDNCGRPIVLSLSPGDETPGEQALHVTKHANLWRISSDFWDDWYQLEEQFELLHKWEEYIGPGHWPDADMIPIGLLNRRGPDDGIERHSNFTDIEKQTLMTLWAIGRSPLMYGGDLRMMRPVELRLLTNDEVIAVNKNSLNNRQLFREGNIVAWTADIPGTQDIYLALFNLGEDRADAVQVNLEEMGFKGAVKMRDLWEQTDLGEVKSVLSQNIESHGSKLFKLGRE
jgi:alpha-galactosidase